MLIHQDLRTLPIPSQAKHDLRHLPLYITGPLLLHHAGGWGGWLMCQPDLSSTHAPEAGGEQRCNAAAGFICQLSGLPVQSRQEGKTPCSTRLSLRLLPLHPLSLPGGSPSFPLAFLSQPT